MSDTNAPAWIPKVPLVYEEPGTYIYGAEGTTPRQALSAESQITRALISIANSLLVIADETSDMSPVIHAAFIIGDAMNAEDDAEPLPLTKGRAS